MPWILPAVLGAAGGALLFGSKGGTPAPDPYATAQAQNQVNKDALFTAAQLNQINQTGPLGNISYSGDIGSPDRTQTTTLSPELQKLLNSQIGNTQALSNQASGLLASMGQIEPFNAGTNPVGYMGDGPQFSMAQLLDPRANNPLKTSFDSGGQAQRTLDFSGAPQLSTDFSNLTKQAQDAEYAKRAQYLDPQFAQQEQATRSRLAAQGITEGSDAYNQEMANFGRAKQAAYSDAANQAIGTGDALQNQLFGQNLAARQQSVGETQAQGNFANAGLAQQFAQNQGQAQFYNSAQGQQFNQGMDLMGYNLAANQANNAALATQFNQGLQAGNFNQNLYQQNFNNSLAGRMADINTIIGLNNGQQISPTLPSYQPIPTSTAAQGSPDVVGLTGSNYANQLNANASSMGSIFGGLGRLGAAAVPGCWVAREVYGIENARWVLFRSWMFTKAPKWFLALYLKHGQGVAHWLSDKPRLKASVRRWMEARIKSHLPGLA